MNAWDPIGFGTEQIQQMKQDEFGRLKREGGTEVTKIIGGIYSYFRGFARGFKHVYSSEERIDNINYLMGVSLYSIQKKSTVVDNNGVALLMNGQAIEAGSEAINKSLLALKTDSSKAVGRLFGGVATSKLVSTIPGMKTPGVRGVAGSMFILASLGDVSHLIDFGLTTIEENGIDTSSIENAAQFNQENNTVTVQHPLFLSQIIQPILDTIFQSTDSNKQNGQVQRCGDEVE